MDAHEASAVSPSTPAARLIGRFGAKRLADWTGRHIGRVYRWAAPPAQGGTGGVIPVRVRPRIIAGALADLGQAITHSEFELAEGENYLLGEGHYSADPEKLDFARAE